MLRNIRSMNRLIGISMFIHIQFVEKYMTVSTTVCSGPCQCAITGENSSSVKAERWSITKMSISSTSRNAIRWMCRNEVVNGVASAKSASRQVFSRTIGTKTVLKVSHSVIEIIAKYIEIAIRESPCKYADNRKCQCGSTTFSRAEDSHGSISWY